MTQTTAHSDDTQKQWTADREEQIRCNRAVIELLRAWEHEDAQEQRETLEFLMRALDEDRPSSRVLF
ncbi:MAG TPA: hypothetical protein VF116_08440 [Ktedonobacterales bacterium]